MHEVSRVEAEVTGGEAEVSEFHMAAALRQASLAAAAGEVPVGAVLVAPGGRTWVDHNRTRERSDPTAHAEVLVLRAAAAHQEDWRLLGYSLFVTLEPCSMCAGAIGLARLERLVFGAADPKAGMCGSLGNLVQDTRLNHRVQVTAGVRAEESAGLLRTFFAARR